jgi:L-alanine-DL-glutamate epimerase-like enolase superfamily enzyme
MAKIKDIKVWSADLGNTKPYTIAFKTITEVRSAFVEISLESGVTGIGSGNPSEFVVGESLTQCLEALSENNLEFLIGRDIRELHQLLFEIWKKFPENPSARACLDIALHDAFAKYLDVPLVKYLGQKIKKLPTSITIGIKGVDEALQEAEEYIKRGFKVIKVKVGKDLDEDVERLLKLREKIGNGIALRVDGNQGYTMQQTIELYGRTYDYLNIEFFEQPLPANDIIGMKSLPKEVRHVIAVDESLITPVDAIDLAQSPRAGGIFNIKLMKCGGIQQALKIADIATHRKVDLFWGCNDESIVSITAALHAAYACPNTKYIDLDGSLDLSNDIVTGGFILKDGYMYCNDKPGLGVERK